MKKFSVMSLRRIFLCLVRLTFAQFIFIMRVRLEDYV